MRSALFWDVKAAISCPETSVRNYCFTQRHSPEDSRYQGVSTFTDCRFAWFWRFCIDINQFLVCPTGKCTFKVIHTYLKHRRLSELKVYHDFLTKMKMDSGPNTLLNATLLQNYVCTFSDLWIVRRYTVYDDYGLIGCDAVYFGR